jgi:hypothetical protein
VFLNTTLHSRPGHDQDSLQRPSWKQIRLAFHLEREEERLDQSGSSISSTE